MIATYSSMLLRCKYWSKWLLNEHHHRPTTRARNAAFPQRSPVHTPDRQVRSPSLCLPPLGPRTVPAAPRPRHRSLACDSMDASCWKHQGQMAIVVGAHIQRRPCIFKGCFQCQTARAAIARRRGLFWALLQGIHHTAGFALMGVFIEGYIPHLLCDRLARAYKAKRAAPLL
jgi:hypothetical protein